MNLLRMLFTRKPKDDKSMGTEWTPYLILASTLLSSLTEIPRLAGERDKEVIVVEVHHFEDNQSGDRCKQDIKNHRKLPMHSHIGTPDDCPVQVQHSLREEPTDYHLGRRILTLPWSFPDR